MEVKILIDDKDVLDVELDNMTVAEVLRVYLNENGAKVAVWKQDHPTKNPVLHIEAENPKKILKDSIAAIQKEIDSTVDGFKKLK
ncbi:hypothetical protein HN747_01385 [archaeon]|jgi:DNA-directed RNA polymerase subunit L|nr:hypothetical protein [archaeon]